jgi:N-acetylglucosaminyl-diphospho-decaprenol L-rhamnosyltransferase
VPAEASSLSVVIVTHNSRGEIAACLGSVLAQTGSLATDVVVVDNASTDDTVAVVRGSFPSVRVIDVPQNAGFARANNLGAARARGAFLLLLNPDTVVRDAAVERLLGALEAHPDAAIAGPRLVDSAGDPELSFGPALTPWGELKQKTLLSLYNRKMGPAVSYVERATRSAGPRAWVSGACLLIRRADWDAVGGLDERFFMYTEDVDLCASVRARGRMVWFAPEAEVQHLRGRSAARNPETARLRRLSHIAYYDKHLPRWAGMLRTYLTVTGRGQDA